MWQNVEKFKGVNTFAKPCKLIVRIYPTWGMSRTYIAMWQEVVCISLMLGQSEDSVQL